MDEVNYPYGHVISKVNFCILILQLILKPTSAWRGTIHKLITKLCFVSEPLNEKINSMGFRPGPTQTGLYSHRKKARSLRFWI